MPYLSTLAKFDYSFYAGTMLAEPGPTGAVKNSADRRLIRSTDILINVPALHYSSTDTKSSVEGENVCFHSWQKSFSGGLK